MAWIDKFKKKPVVSMSENDKAIIAKIDALIENAKSVQNLPAYDDHQRQQMKSYLQMYIGLRKLAMAYISRGEAPPAGMNEMLDKLTMV